MEKAQKADENPVRLHLVVTGRVQGVGFRAFVQEQAVAMQVCGWVRNLGYNQVEVVAEGPRDLLSRFSSVVQRGPSYARVDEVREDWEIPTRDLLDFRVRSSR